MAPNPAKLCVVGMDDVRIEYGTPTPLKLGKLAGTKSGRSGIRIGIVQSTKGEKMIMLIIDH